ncbi:MAG: NADPH-dependent FMN reductase [Flavobacteriaceae bacterium]
MSLPRIAIVIGSTREGRFADKPAQWIKQIADARNDASYEIVDLRNFPLPFFEETASPAHAEPKNETARQWARLIDGFDGYIFIAAEYNHSMTAVLKNALDYAYREFNRKPATFIAYGGVGGARAVEQLRQVAVELQLAPVRHAVHIGMTEFVAMLRDGKSFDDFPYLTDSAKTMLSELAWWTDALKTAREAA